MKKVKTSEEGVVFSYKLFFSSSYDEEPQYRYVFSKGVSEAEDLIKAYCNSLEERGLMRPVYIDGPYVEIENVIHGE